MLDFWASQEKNLIASMTNTAIPLAAEQSMMIAAG